MTPVDVYLVPVGSARYELYCESAEVDGLAAGDERPQGGLYARFRRLAAELAESRRARTLAAVSADPAARRSWVVRLRDFVVGRVAEAIAEWRLLWHLRTQSEATLVHPGDLPGEQALAESRAQLQRDADRHLKRLAISSVAALILGVLFFFVPGPNLLAYYFWFLTVGHLFAWRGARHGLHGVKWHTRASDPLVELRRILELDPQARVARVRDVQTRLQLEHLAAFVHRLYSMRS